MHDHQIKPLPRIPETKTPTRDESAQRKTIAGSSRITRWTLSKLDRMQIKTIRAARDRQQPPGCEEGQFVPAALPAEEGRQPDTHPVAEQADDRRLQQDHADDLAVGHSHRLQVPNCLSFRE